MDLQRKSDHQINAFVPIDDCLGITPAANHIIRRSVNQQLDLVIYPVLTGLLGHFWNKRPGVTRDGKQLKEVPPAGFGNGTPREGAKIPDRAAG
jgi:hypothetical protein